jgi:hypothetical protein
MTILAYIDPGQGPLVWQMIVAAFVGFVFYLKQTRRWIVGVFLKIFRRGKKLPDNVTEKAASGEFEGKIDSK